MPEIMGFSHVDLTVTDCEHTARWWSDVMGFTLFNQVRGETFECRSLVHPCGLAVTVMTHDATAELGAFDERRVGLDHFAFRVRDRDELQRWAEELRAKGVANTGIIDTGMGRPSCFGIPTTSNSSSTCTPDPTSGSAAEPRYFLAISPSTILLKSAVPKDTYSDRLA
jgi:catechol 2,3-dioxygenase-like lactoylglutathione lyase family enzyme